MKVAFFSWLAKSNINASIPLIRDLCERGCEVYYFGFKKYRDDIESLGVNFVEYSDNLNLGNDERFYDDDTQNDEKFIEEKKNLNTIDDVVNEYMFYYKRTIKMYSEYENEVLNIIKNIKPNLIIKDNSAQHGKMIGYKLKIKTIAFSPMMVIDKNYLRKDIKNLFFNYNLDRISNLTNNQLIEAYDKIECEAYNFCQENNLPYITPIEPQNGEDEISLVYGGEPLNIKLRDNRIKFIKPPLNEMQHEYEGRDKDLEKFINDEKPLIYIASGASITGDSAYYSTFIRALWDKNYNVIISIPNVHGYNKNLPENFLIRPFVKQQLVLEKAAVFITFGGYNSICEAIEYSTPMIVYPQMNDQFINAKR